MAAQGEKDLLLGDEGDQENRLIFPLDKETMSEFMQPVSSAALVGICTGSVLPLQGSTNEKACKLFRVIYFLFLPIGLIGLLLSVAAKRVPRLFGAAAGFLLFEFCLISVLGCIAAILELGGNALPAATVAIILVVITIFGWIYCCSYPKCICRAVAQLPPPRTITADQENVHRCSICSPITNVHGVPLHAAADGEERCPQCVTAYQPI